MSRNGVFIVLMLILLGSAIGQADETIRIGEPNKADLYAPAPVYREQALKELGDSSLIDIDDLVSKPEIPPGKSDKPILKKLPQSFRKRVQRFRGKYDSRGIEVAPTLARTTASLIVINSYLSDHVVSGIGKIDEIESGEKVAAIGQNVVIRLTRTGNRGEKLSAIFSKNKIVDPIRGEVGPIVENGGNLEIGDTIDEAKHVYRAMVTSSVNPVRVNSIVTEAPLQRADFKRTGSRVTVASRVIGGEFDAERKQVGEGSIVYLDGGTDAGWKVGDIVPVQAKRGAHREVTKYPNWLRTIGLLKIVDVQNSVSTAVVLENSEEINIGDLTGGEAASPLPDLHMNSDNSSRAEATLAPAPNAAVPNDDITNAFDDL